MPNPLLVVGNKLYASWSLRVWFLMRAFGVPFDEKVLSIYQSDSKPVILAHSPSGRVPVLIDGACAIWDTLAITEYLAERHPELPIWPREPAARALARSICAEMHAEFRALRAGCPMNLGKRFGMRDRGSAVAQDVARIGSVIQSTRSQYGAEGAYLFGRLSAADAFYLPVMTRFFTYAIETDKFARTYMKTVLGHPAYLEWRQAALDEPWVIEKVEVDEPPIEVYRKHGR